MDVFCCVVTDFGQLSEFVALEELVWGLDLADAVPANMLHTVSLNGGVLVGAYSGDCLVGMCFGLPGRRGRDWFLWSHMAGVHPDFQGLGIGAKLKYVQREWSLDNDYTKILWTFDPLQRRNANFNIHKLGATSEIYHINYYGEMTDGINAGLPSDRLEVVWDITTDTTRRPDTKNQTIAEDSMLLADVNGEPSLGNLPASESQPTFIEIPSDIAILKAENPDLALQWRLATRDAFQTAFAKHYTVTDFTQITGRGLYVLSPLQPWFMYVVECVDQSLYTGITNDLQRRIDQHNSGKGAAYTAARRPVKLLAAWKFPGRGIAQKAEAAFKKQRRREKIARIRLQEHFWDGEFVTSG